MAQETALAFAHPVERAAALSPDIADRISVRDMVVELDIGAFQAERGALQRVRFNIVVEVTEPPSDLGDDVDRILSYDRITEAIHAELDVERLALLETLAERIAVRILLEPQAQRAFVKIEKLDRGPGALGVEIVRDKPKVETVRSLSDTPHPVVVFLSNAAIDAPDLIRWIDAAQSHERPALICVGLPPDMPLRLDHAMVQRRIDLLAMEQNAWRLAAKDDRCVVVSTRTELDWGMRNDQICVWAPSKLVLDAVEGPSGAVTDEAGLMAWFAAEMDAAEKVAVGVAWPELGEIRTCEIDKVTL